MSIDSGKMANDILTDNEVFVIGPTGETIDEQVATYDYNKNPVTVFDLEKEKDYSCNPEDAAIEVVYPDRIEELFGTTDVSVEDIKEKMGVKKIKPYYFPESRLEQ